MWLENHGSGVDGQISLLRCLDIIMEPHWLDSPDIASEGVGSFDCALSPIIPPTGGVTDDRTGHIDLLGTRKL